MRQALPILMVLPLLAGCPAKEDHRPQRVAPAKEATATVQVQQEPDLLNPFASTMASATAISCLFYSGLLLLNDHGEFAPDLAERVPTLANGDVKLGGGGMTVTYRLRKGVTWHDGKPFSASDVVATYKLVMDPRFPSVTRAGYELIREVKALDANTAQVAFKVPYAPYLELFPFVLPAHVAKLSEHPERETWNREPIGTGPYRFERWTSGDRVVAHAFDGYFRGKPSIPRLEVRFTNQDMTAFNLWRSGELDLLQGASPTQFDFLQREAPRRVHQTPVPSWEHLLFNLKNPILSDVRVRRAIAHLIDREKLNTAAYGGVFQPAWSELPQNSWAYERSVEHGYPYDTAKAMSLLEAAGWKPGPNGIRQRNGKPLKLTLVTTAERPSRELAAQLWRRQWKDAGIELELDKMPASSLFAIGSSAGPLAKGTYDLALVASFSRPDPDTSFRWRSDQVPPNGQNRTRYNSPVVDALLKAGQQTIPRPERRKIYAKLARQLGLDLPVIPLLYWVGIDATSRRLQGYRPNPTLRGNLWNVWEWKLKQE
jgi:peptide/nickel transport system substrate-binding protein